jgi:hypothetical protein
MNDFNSVLSGAKQLSEQDRLPLIDAVGIPPPEAESPFSDQWTRNRASRRGTRAGTAKTAYLVPDSTGRLCGWVMARAIEFHAAARVGFASPSTGTRSGALVRRSDRRCPVAA